MFDSDLGLREQLLSGFLRVEDPVCFFGDVVGPDIGREAGVCPEDILEPDLFAHDLNHILISKLLLLVLAVDFRISAACLHSQLHSVDGDELANLLEHRWEVFVACGNLFVLIIATVLQDLVEGIGFVDGFA